MANGRSSAGLGAAVFGMLAVASWAGLALASPAVSVKGSGITRTIDCAESPRVVVTGTGHRLTLKGRCESVEISGVGNHVHAEGLGRVSMSGLDHLVEWQYALNGSKPSVSSSGTGRVVHVEAAASAGKHEAEQQDDDGEQEASDSEAQIGSSGISAGTTSTRGGRQAVDGMGVRRTLSCNGGDVEVNGTSNVVRLEGNCGRVVVNGMGQRVTVEAARAIEVNGVSQDVSWVRGVDQAEPRVQSAGLGNSVRRISAAQFKQGAK